MSRQDSKFVDPSIYVDPLAPEFSGIECCIRWCDIFGNCPDAEIDAAARAAEEARRLYEQESARATQLIEQQRQLAAEEYKAQEFARTEALTAQQESKVALEVAKRQSSALQQQQKGLIAAETRMGATAETMPTTTGQPEVKRSRGSAPKVAFTKVSTRPSIGGYSGTTAGRVNPTGLNI